MKEKEKTAGELLTEKIMLNPENGGSLLSDEEIARADVFCEDYKLFLDQSKTEYEAVRSTLKLLERRGYVPHRPKAKYKPGDKIYLCNRGKAILFATIGTAPIAEGVRLLASHIDSPRLDLKPRPLYEEGQIALFKTHYYGGIKKYQWSAIPLSLHGVIVKKDGTRIDINIGEDEGDPQFCITDLLPHLAKEQMERKLSDGIRGEELNLLAGSRPFRDDKATERVRLNVMRLLHEKYNITEADLLSSDLCAVPAFRARDIGLDRSMIGSYGHDDRVCAYTSMMASLEQTAPKHTWITVLADKEEVGSDGNTGLNSRYLQYFVEDLAEAEGIPGRFVFSKSLCLSADVNCAFDPTFPDVNEKRNTSYIGYGAVISKYTGSGGKYSTSEATAEFMGKVRKILDDGNVLWQVGELGKVDAGGGGTVAKYIAKLDVDVVDIGVPVLSMHAPFEVVSKIDVYMTYKAFSEFLKS